MRPSCPPKYLGLLALGRAVAFIACSLSLPHPAPAQEPRLEPILKELERNFNSLTTLRMEYTLKQEGEEDEDGGRPSAVLWLDLPNKKALLGLKESPSTPEIEWTASVENMKALFWSGAESSRMDFGEIIDILEDPLLRVRRASAAFRGAPRPEDGLAARLRKTTRIRLFLRVRGNQRDSEGYFRFVFAWTASGGASWFDDIRRAQLDSLVADKEKVVFNLLSPTQTIAIDRATGLIRTWQVTHHNGKKATVRLKSLKQGVERPDVRVPKNARPINVPQELWWKFAESLESASTDWRGCLALRENLEKDADALQKLLTLTAAHGMHVQKLLSYRRWMDQYVTGRLRQGAPRAVFLFNLEGEYEAFRAWIRSSADALDTTLANEVESKAKEFENSLPDDWPEDLRKRVTAHIRKAFDYEAVKKAEATFKGPSMKAHFQKAVIRASKP